MSEEDDVNWRGEMTPWRRATWAGLSEEVTGREENGMSDAIDVMAGEWAERYRHADSVAECEKENR